MAGQGEEPITTKLYYPIGNTPPIDVTLGCHVSKQCDILLLGCGDIRNVLCTTHALLQNGTLRSSDHVINFHLNDNESAIITRDLILFNIVKSVNPDDEDDMKFLWSVWYEVLMTKANLDRLFGLMTNMTKHKSGAQNVWFGNDETEQSVKNCLAGWSKIQHSVDEVREKRQRYLMEKYKELYEDLPTKRTASRMVDNYQIFKDERLKDRYTQEVREYTDTGITRNSASNMSQKQVLATFCVNETFFPADCKEWSVPDDSSPFLCYETERDTERYDGGKTTMSKICLEILTDWVRSFQAADSRCTLKIHLWLDNAKSLCEKTLPENLTFDFIDTSNLTDEMGLIPLLMHCQERLKEDTGVLGTETFDWYRCLSHGEHFLRLCLDISPLMYPTVLGLHLADELNIGHEGNINTGHFEGCHKLVFRWRKAATFTPCTLTGEDGISTCFQIIKSPKTLQSAEVFQQVRSALLDDNTKEKVAERLKKMTRDQTSISKSGSTGAPGNKGLVVEYNDRYEVTIHIPGTDTAGDLSVIHDDPDKRTVILQLATDRTTNFRTTLRFSCPVSIQESIITQSKTKGLIQGTFLKDQDITVGERVLPWKQLTRNEISSFPDYPTSEFSLLMLRLNLVWVYPQGDIPASQQDKPSPLHQLQDILAYLLLFAPVKLQTMTLCVPRRKPLGESPLEKFQSTIVTDGYKLWDQKATSFVTVVDHDAVLRLTREGKMTMLDFLRDTGHYVRSQVLNEKLLQGYDSLSRIFRINSYRLSQDSVNSRWKMRSFIRFRYPFNSGMNHGSASNAQTRYMEAGMLHDPFALLQCMQEVLESDGHELPSTPAGLKVLETVMSTYKPVCACCGKMTDCKMCTACNSVYYCSRRCQKRAWPQHKLQCNK